MSKGRSTTELDQILGKMNPDKIQDYLWENRDDIFIGKEAFTDYMRTMFKEKKVSQQEVFLKADMPERYGYKIISGEKHTLQRDVILRLCIAAGFDVTETGRALKLYGFSELYSKVPRDAVIISFINSNKRDIEEINSTLTNHKFEELYSFRSDSES